MVHILEHKKVEALINGPNGAAAKRYFKHIEKTLHPLFREGKGKSKHQDKLNNHGKPYINRIYSYRTYCNYLSVCRRYGIWVIQTHHCYSLQKARAYVAEYLRMRIDCGLSAWTIHLDASALAKLYQCSYLDFYVDLPRRYRADIIKNFIDPETLDRIEKKYPDLARFCKSCGLRREELTDLKINDIYTTSSGQVIVHVRQGKGGKERTVIALNSFPIQLRDRAIGDGRNRIFESIPNDFPSHVYRKLFARTLYDSIARDTSTLIRKQCYYCRRDMKGYVFDRAAMNDVSVALGHKRLSVVTTYLKQTIIVAEDNTLMNAA